ncbi:hypothetical protein [Salarchaeum japonicum]|uniref:HIT-type domain-containing protein n=1 Tax=Salarchaeum japonicum TaxID=555573 RepID=A0AAV3SXL2_9EURY|nr:hypothetical protein [Salarchaeum japonicum]
MSVTGVCQICESADARHACDQCGRVVCRDHYDRDTGFCTECARQYGDRETDESGERVGRDERGESPDDWGEPR